MSKRIQKILFLTDFSKNAENAFYYTIKFAKIIQAEILILHTFKSADTSIEVVEKEEGSVKKKLTEQLSGLAAQGRKIEPALSFNTLVLPGNYTDFINDIIREKDIDLIIMATEGAEPIKAFLMGTNAARILEKASCPVMIIPRNYSFEPIHKIFFATEFLETDIRNTIYISDIAELFNAEITIGNIADEEKLIQGIITKSFETDLRRTISYPKIKFVCLDGKNIEKRIADYAEKKSVDLIVMSTHYRSKFEKLYNKSLTKKVAYKTHIPLLALHV